MNDPRTLFMQYEGDHYEMARDGVLKTYESFSVSDAQEEIWIDELRQKLLTQLAADPIDADTVHSFCNTVVNSQNIDSILPLVELARVSIERLDSFSKIRYSEELLNALSEQKTTVDRRTSDNVRRVVRMLLDSALMAPVTVANYYRDKYPDIGGTESLYSVDSVRSRANQVRRLLDK